MFDHMDMLKRMFNLEKNERNVGKIVHRLLSFALINESLAE